jgi:hypothetical protein
MAKRAFSFYPPILNVEHNEWRFRKATWSEVLVTNAKSDLEIWIPRRLIVEVSSVDQPVMIVGLSKELEYKAGTVWPHERKLIEMPSAGIPVPLAAPAEHSPARGADGGPTERRVGRLIGMILALGLLVCCAVIFIFRAGPLRTVEVTSADQDYLSLTRGDDYFAVVRKLGQPGEEHWRVKGGDLMYRALWYPERSYYVILFGGDRNDTRYIGVLDRNWRVLNYVDLPNGGNTASILRSLEKF